MIHGEIHAPADSPGDKFVVLTSDGWNAGQATERIIAQIVRQRGFGSEYFVELTDLDPVSGSILLPWPHIISADTPTSAHGMVTGATMDKIKEALRLLYDL